MLWEHEPQASVSTAFSSSPKLSRVFVFLKYFAHHKWRVDARFTVGPSLRLS